MGASFRSVDEILALAGCDLLTISPDLIDKMATMEQQISRQLYPDMEFNILPKEILDKETFNAQVNADPITTELLKNGIDGFVKAREELAIKLQSLI